MTQEQLFSLCKSLMEKPLTRMQTRIGFPREKSLGGYVMTRIAKTIAPYVDSEPELRSCKITVGLSNSQLRTLEKELDRPLINSGDLLFGVILIQRIDCAMEDGPYFDLTV